MTRAEIQSLIDARGEITLPHTGHYLDGPLIMRAGAHLNLSGGTLIKWFDGAGAVVTSNDPVWSLRNGVLEGAGVQLTGGVNFFELQNLYIHAAPVAYDASGGVWMGRLTRVQAKECVDGFRQVDGTTMAFENCFANACSGHAWNIENVYSASVRSCAADNNTGEQAVRFALCDALTIQSWYMEGNQVPGWTCMLLDQCRGDVGGLVSLVNVLSAGSGLGSVLVQINAGRVGLRAAQLGGAPKRNADTASGVGISRMLLLSGGAVVVLSASELYHADKASGAGTAYPVFGSYIDGGGNAIGAVA